MDIKEAINCSDLTYTTKEILSRYDEGKLINKIDFYPNGVDPNNYLLFM